MEGWRQTLGVGAVLIAIGLAGLLLALQISPSFDGGLGARILPLAASAIVLVLGAVELWRGLRHRLASPFLGRGDASSEPIGLRDIFAMLLLAVAYLWLIGKLGYLIPTALSAPAALWLFGVRRPAGLMAAAVLCPLFYHLVFFELLGLFPPRGAWFDLLDLIR